MQPMSIQLLLGLALLAETSPWVIPPGREGVLVQMLDVKGLPNGCTLAGADPQPQPGFAVEFRPRPRSRMPCS